MKDSIRKNNCEVGKGVDVWTIQNNVVKQVLETKIGKLKELDKKWTQLEQDTFKTMLSRVNQP